MNALAHLSFAHPEALVALLALPVIWWLLRVTPPRPRTVRFAPFRILAGLTNRRQEAARTPWWLILLRLSLAAALILAVAGPRIAPPSPDRAAAGKGAVLIVLDNGWAAARNWAGITRRLSAALDEAAARNRPVILAVTAPGAPFDPAARRAEKIRSGLTLLKPRALAPDRAALMARIRKARLKPAHTIWLSDGLDYGAAKDFATGLSALGGALSVHAPAHAALPLAVLPPRLKNGGLHVRILRAPADGQGRGRVLLRARNGRPLGGASFGFAPGKREARAVITLPLAVRNEAAMLSISGQHHAGAVWLFDDRFRRKSVLVFSGESRGRGQPLLSPAYYILRAIQPLAEVAEIPSLAALDERLNSALSMLILADVGRLDARRRAAIARWVKRGGVLLRFSGPRLAGGHDDLIPVRLRAGGRQLGAALSWEKPQRLAPFGEKSPFAGLSPDRDITVTRQVLAEPAPELAERTWAALEDGTPLVTAKRTGAGLVILVHTTASPDWSNLPMSGLFVDMLSRLLDLAPAARPPGSGKARKAAEGARAASGPWTPLRALDGFGNLAPPPVEAEPVRAADFAGTRPSPNHPAGLYARAGAVRALNVTNASSPLAPLPPMPAGVSVHGYDAARARDFAPPLFIAAFILFLLDALAMLVLAGALARIRPARAAATLMALALILPFWPHAAHAGEKDDALAFAMKATEKTRLAYVLTGDEETDAMSRAGLSGLSYYLTMRTSVEPGEPMAVDIARDDIAFFPLIYWPVRADAKRLSPPLIAKLDAFLKNGGTILFDTRDAPEAAVNGAGNTAAARALRRILSGLDIPPLEPAPKTHVLTRSFYLLKSFPGRFAGSPLWVEATSAGRERRKLSTGNADGVSAILITGNGMAGAWAINEAGRPLLPAVPGGERQREYAIRTGINIVMYALTGNYKADQVHIPAILRRLGQ